MGHPGGRRTSGPQAANADEAARASRRAARGENRRNIRGIYHHVQVEFAYNSNHIEGSRLTHEQTRLIFETNTISVAATVRVDDILETANHFRCVDTIIDSANRHLTERLIKGLHAQLKQGTTDSRKGWFAVGDYKRLPNEVGGRETADPRGGRGPHGGAH